MLTDWLVDKLAEPGALALENVFFYLRKKIDTGQCFVD